MSDFWSGWIMTLVVINYVTILILFIWATRVNIPTDEDGTTGHSWANGTIREGLQKLPRWWLVMSSLGFVAAFIYLVLYPGFGNNEGIYGWTSTKQMHEQIVESNAKKAPLIDQIQAQSVLELTKNNEALKVGKRLFEDNCAACHGYEAQGSQLLGAPKLTDNIWLYGGKASDVIHTITYGRQGIMPAHNASLDSAKINNVANYVLSLSGLAYNEAAAEKGQPIFAQTCAVCHSADATGNQMLGAPNLTDDDWLYGNSITTVKESISNGRHGVMPAWDDRLNENQIKLLAAWVLSHDNTEQAVAAGEE